MSELILSNNLRRYREIYEVFSHLRYQKGHTSSWTAGWIERNYFKGQETLYRILRGAYGDMKEIEFDESFASAAYHAAFSPNYQDYS